MKKVIDSIKIIVTGIAVVVALFFYIQWRDAKTDHTELQGLLSDTIHHFELVITDQGQEIAIQEQTVASLENALAAGLVTNEDLKNKNLKQLEHIIRLENQVVMEDIEVDLPDSNLVTVTDLITAMPPGSYLKVPTDFFYSDEWLELDGIITGSQIVIRELQITTKPSIFIGYQKTGLFKPLRPVVTVEDANPYVHTVKMHNVTIRSKPPFYKRPWFHRFEGMALVIAGQIILNKTR